MKNFEKYIDRLFTYGRNPRCAVCAMRNLECSHTEAGCKERVKSHRQWLLEEYVEPIQLTHDEYVILKNVDRKYKWIARNENKEYFSFTTTRPSKQKIYWNCDDKVTYVGIFSNLFQFIKWEDEEPHEIAKLIADYEKENEDENC